MQRSVICHPFYIDEAQNKEGLCPLSIMKPYVLFASHQIVTPDRGPLLRDLWCIKLDS